MVAATYSFGQLKTSDASITFHSEMDDITAENTTVKSTLDTQNGEITFSVSIDAFAFANKLMQKHFNEEGVMNSAEFPVAKFEGKIINNNEVDYTADGEYNVRVSGKMSIKGVTKEFGTSGMIVIKNGKISAVAQFDLDRFEYGVTGKEQSVSQVLQIEVKANY